MIDIFKDSEWSCGKEHKLNGLAMFFIWGRFWKSSLKFSLVFICFQITVLEWRPKLLCPEILKNGDIVVSSAVVFVVFLIKCWWVQCCMLCSCLSCVVLSQWCLLPTVHHRQVHSCLTHTRWMHQTGRHAVLEASYALMQIRGWYAKPWISPRTFFTNTISILIITLF